MSRYKNSCDLIPTIDDDEEITDFSENSDNETDFQPSIKKKKKSDFNDEFNFISSETQYQEDPWADLSKYIKRKASTKTDDKIQKARENIIKNDKTLLSDEDEEHTERSEVTEIKLSDDELKRDNIRDKKKYKKLKKQDQIAAADFFEEAPVHDGDVTFYQMNLSRPLLKAIGTMNFLHPTPIQSATIPVALLGKDICGCAATGTGKTAAYMLPALERLLYRSINETAITRMLVLVPTRELGVQVYQISKKLAQFTTLEIGLSVGGLDLKSQELILRKNPDIVIATPGRLIDHLKSTPNFSLTSVEILVLDEADRMLDEYFAEQMKEIIKDCSRTRQTMLFSATMTDEVNDLATMSLNKPVKIFVDGNQTVAMNLRQEFIRIRKDRESDRESILAALVCRTFHSNCMIFVQMKKQAHRLRILFGLLGIKVGELHGNLTQLQRLEALKQFKEEETDVLITTDVAARGLDISGVKTVINFVMPPTLEHYIHRVGRTARAGKTGVSVSLAGEQERKIVKEIIKQANNPVKMRIIPPDIIQKYRTRINVLDDEVNKILQEEYEERMLRRAEMQVNRAQNLLNNSEEGKNDRPWFQTKIERKREKARLDSSHEKKVKEKNNRNKKDVKQLTKLNKKDKFDSKKNKKGNQKNGDDETDPQLQKVMMKQARLAKRKSKANKIQSCVTKDFSINSKNKKKKSAFDDNLFSTSNKNVKKFRHVSNSHQKKKKKTFK